MPNLDIDLKYEPRKWQKEFHQGAAGKRFGLALVARQHGKTELGLREVVHRALSGKPGVDYAYVAPFASQGRKIAWPRLKTILAPLAKYTSVRETDMILTLPNRCRIHILSADNESARGMVLGGMLIDEFDNIKSQIYKEVLLPTTASFGDEAWMIFIGTLKPNGKLYKLYLERKDDPDWHVQITRASEAGVLTTEQLARFRLEIGDSAYLREFEADPNAPTEYSILGELLHQARLDDRILPISTNPVSRIFTSWDLGFRDFTSCWFFQLVGQRIHWFDYMEFQGKGLPEIAHQIKSKYSMAQFDTAVLPHDAANHDVGTGLSRVDIFYDLDLGYPDVLERHQPAESLHAARLNVPRSVFDEDRCELGIRRLTNAAYQIDARTGSTLDRAVHDDNSHAFDAFRYGALWIEDRYPSGDSVSFRPGMTSRHFKTIRCIK